MIPFDTGRSVARYLRHNLHALKVAQVAALLAYLHFHPESNAGIVRALRQEIATAGRRIANKRPLPSTLPIARLPTLGISLVLDRLDTIAQAVCAFFFGTQGGHRQLIRHFGAAGNGSLRLQLFKRQQLMSETQYYRFVRRERLDYYSGTSAVQPNGPALSAVRHARA